MHIVRRITALVAVGLTAVTAVAVLGAGHAAAAEVAPDAEQAVRDIVFPVAGPHTYSDTFGACRSGCTRGHEGTDIMTPKLTPLVAARDATVTWLKDTATPDGSQGNYLMLRDAEGWEYWYIHINNDSPGTDDGANPKQWIFGPGIARGSRVEAGQLVAYAGDSGNAEWTGSHLHFEIHKPDGSIINPYRSLQAAPQLAAPVGADAVNEAFIRALFADFIGRPPSDLELVAKLGELAAGWPRAAVVDGFTQSDTWVAALIDGYYRSTLGRSADADGREFWMDVIRSGSTPAAVAAEFYASDEYYRIAGGTPEGWVRDLYAELLHRAPEPGGLGYWTGTLTAGTPRREIAMAFYQSLESRRTRVTGLYRTLLGRTPDVGGRDYWADVLADGRDLRLALFLASSDEYLQRARARF